jgi:antitoxin VapB
LLKGDTIALCIIDNAVDKLAAKVQQTTGAAGKTEAVRRAQENELARSRKSKPLSERLEHARPRSAPRTPHSI